MTGQKLLALILPLLALGLQWLLWPWIAPFVWFLFFPTVFISARLGGFYIGLISTVMSAAFVWFFFIPPQLSWAITNVNNLYSVGMFMAMGYLFSDTQERLRLSKLKTEMALAETQSSNDKITELYQKTLELDELKNQFFANISHELRTPLTLIMSPVAKRLASAELSDAERLENEMILRNARLLYRHVTDLLDVAKIESGEMSLHWSQIDLAALTRITASHFDSLASERNIAYSLEIPASLLAKLDSEKIQRVLLNLLSNAFKFTPDGGSISLKLIQLNDQAQIELCDNGPGIPPAMRLAIFERFRQVEGSAQRRFSGTGLGLAIVKNFVELHGGTVTASQSSIGGAMFVVSLPLHAPAGIDCVSPSNLDETLEHQLIAELKTPLANHAQAVRAGINPNHFRVLVVEDNPDMRQFIANALSQEFTVITASQGLEGLDKAIQFKPDVIITDLMMPEMGGDEMIKQLRMQPIMQDVPVVVLTARDDDIERLRLLKSGIQAYLNKPFSIEELLIQVNNLITARRTRLEALEASEKALKAAQQLAGIGNWHWDIANNQHVWSEQVYILYGRDPALPPAGYPEVKKYFTAASWDKLTSMIEQSLQNGQPYNCDAEVVRPDGSHLWITAHGEATFDEIGKIIALSGTVQDITERKLAEERIRQLNANLERRVLERTAELSAANRELDSFAYAVSHDLRAPLRAMSGFSQALIEDYSQQLPDEAQLYLNQIILGSQKMGELIDGILTLSRSTRGELQYVSVDLSGLSLALLTEFQHSEPCRKVNIDIENGLTLRGDSQMIEILMRNLLSNAWKYTSKLAEASIKVYKKCDLGFEQICVSDNGAGFDMSYANRLFQPFQRLHRLEEFPGLGIGLATVERIVHRHGGSIQAHSQVDQGTTFSFSFSDHQQNNR